MNRIKFLQITVLSLFLVFTFASCKTSMESRVKDVQLGMTKPEIVSKFGKKYEIVKLEKTDKGDEEVIRYPIYRKNSGKKKIVERYYVFGMLNNELIKYSNENADISTLDTLDFYNYED